MMIKKYFFICTLLLLSNRGNAQIFNTGQTLKKGVVALGAQALFPTNNSVYYPIVYAHAGYGITSGIDVAAVAGLDINSVHYLGANVEFALLKNMSLALGAHKSGSFGLDGTFLFDIPFGKKVRLYSGVDSDTDFVKSTNTDEDEVMGTSVRVWIPVGVEIEINKSTHLLFESSIAVSPDAYHVGGGGIMFYF